jgi:uncharacterized OsmC-like protein
MVAELSHLPFDGMAISLVATREDRPPRVAAIHYALGVVSSLPRERVERLQQLAEKNSTVFQALAGVIQVTGELHHQRPDGEAPTGDA